MTCAIANDPWCHARKQAARLPNGNSDLPGAPPATKYVKFEGNLLMVGFGSIGQGTLPLVIKHIDMPANKITIFTPEDRGAEAKAASERYGVNYKIGSLLKDNYAEVLEPLLKAGDYLLNLSVDTGSCDLMQFCSEHEVLYLDTVVEPWLGGYTDSSLTPSQRSNYAQREEMLALRAKLGPDAPTAVTTHGANPGLVSHFVKQALLNIAKVRLPFVSVTLFEQNLL